MTRYQLSIHAEKLSRGLFKRPNPQAEVKITGGPRNGEVIGKTEVMDHTVDPDFTRVLFLETDASIFLPFSVTIRNTRNNQVLAEANKFEATEVFNAKGHLQSHECTNGARVYASMEESIKGNTRGKFTLHLRGLDIKNVEPGIMGLGRSDPFYEISKKDFEPSTGTKRWNVIHRSENIMNHLNPLWRPVTLSLEELCYCDLNWPLKITVLDFEENGKHETIGEFETTIEQLRNQVAVRGNADRDRAFNISSEGKKSAQNKTRGLIVVLKAELELNKELMEEQQQQSRSAAAPVVVPSEPYAPGAPPGPFRPVDQRTTTPAASSPNRPVVVPAQPYTPGAAPGPYRPTEESPAAAASPNSTSSSPRRQQLEP